MNKNFVFRHQFDDVIIADAEKFESESPVVSGQALTGAELHRRITSGLPVGCAVRSFDSVNPYLDKIQVYDAIESFKIRHGMVHKEPIETHETEIPTPAESVTSADS